MRKWPPTRLNLARQLVDLQNLYPQGTGHIVKHRLRWRGKLRPSPLSREYLVQIDYSTNKFPRVLVLEPKPRELAGGQKPPHVYTGEGDPLCLFYPPAGEWSSSMLIARTIVPWTCEWLFHFEAWLFSGEWDGGGIEHEPQQEPNPRE